MSRQLRYRDLERLNRVLLTALELKAPLAPALEAASRGQAASRLKSALIAVSAELNGGKSLSAALEELPDVLPKAYRQIMSVAEKNENILEGTKAAEQYLKRMVALESAIWNSAIYPMAVLTAGYVLVFALVAFVFPKITGVFETILGGPGNLPAHAKAVVSFIQGYGVIILFCGLPGLGLACKQAFILLRPSSNTPRLDAFRMRLPLFGTMFLAVSRARFETSVVALANAGAPFVNAIKAGASASGNAVLERAVKSAVERTSDGSTLSESLRQTGFFSSSFCWLMSAAEERGDMARTFAALQEGPTSASRTPRLPSVSEHVMTAIVATAFFGVVGLVVFLSANLFHGG